MRNDLNICVAGWYGMPCCYEPLKQSKYIVNIVAHRELDTYGIPVVVLPDIGLEFGCFEYYRKHLWDKKSNVLFLHDDNDIRDISFIEDIKINSQVIMIWHDEKHYKRNLAHSRAFVVSSEYLEKYPFWYDENNYGNTDASKGANKAMGKFYQNTKNITSHHYTNKIRMGHRGVIK